MWPNWRAGSAPLNLAPTVLRPAGAIQSGVAAHREGDDEREADTF
jgi:hypothetical protein